MIDKLKGKFISNKNKFVAAFMTLVVCLSSAVMCFAEGTEPTTFDVVSTVTSSFGGVATTLLAILAACVGSVMLIVGAKLGVTKAIAFFKTLVGKA